MADSDRLVKYGVVLMGLLLGLGFSAGPIFSYMGITGSGQTNNDNQQNQKVTLPENSFSDGSFELSIRQQRVLAANTNSVFVTLLYENSEERQRFLSYDGVQNDFRGRMFIQVVNRSENPQYEGLGRDVEPKAVFIGGARGASGIEVLEEVDEENIRTSGCSVLSTWNPDNAASVTSLCSQ